MSKLAVSGAHPMATIIKSKLTGGRQEKPLIPLANRQKNVAAVQQIISTNNRLQPVTEQIDAQQLIIAELQVLDEETKQAINELTLHIDFCKKNNQVLQKTLEMVTRLLGLNLSQILHTSDSSTGTSGPSQTGNLTKEESDQLS
ncbi:hypothetical protein FRC11_002949, partial [Ceratobasidium sp. 423]